MIDDKKKNSTDFKKNQPIQKVEEYGFKSG